MAHHHTGQIRTLRLIYMDKEGAVLCSNVRYHVTTLKIESVSGPQTYKGPLPKDFKYEPREWDNPADYRVGEKLPYTPVSL